MTCESYDPPFIIKFDDFKNWKPCNGVIYLNSLPKNSRVDTIWCVCKEIKIYKILKFDLFIHCMSSSCDKRKVVSYTE